MQMDFFETVKKRYSYRGLFKDEIVPEKVLKQIVQAGLDAPSGKNMQTTSFVIVTDQHLLSKIGSMHTMKAMNTMKALIVCITDKEAEAVYEGHSFQIEDCAAAVENILLAVSSLGYGSVWIDGWLRVKNRSADISNILGIPDSKTIRVILPVGIPVEEGPKKEKLPFEERAWFNTYKNT
jgi:nitroreductase